MRNGRNKMAGAAATAPGTTGALGATGADGLGGGRKKAKRIRVSAIGPDGAFKVSGQTARALQELIAAGQRGITALEVSTWALRLAAYVRDLRKLGLSIDTIRERHNELGDWHGRYVLQSPVEIVEGGA